MAIVTGDRYLEFLVRFVERQTGPLLDGTLTLKLNPVGLHYVQSRLEALEELELLLAGAPVDYLRAYVSDLGDHRALEQLQRILRLLTSLKVISVLPPPARDPTPLSLLPFGRLKVLELRGCDLSTSEARGLLELRHTLEKLICYNSTDALRHVFASRIADINDSPMWNRLSFVSCACNGLILMDESLQLLPAVETLDLSRNHFAKVNNLRKCTKLQHLDLGFNHLRTIASLSEVSCPIVKLVLRNNALTTLRGIENLKSVEGVDLSYNIISNFSELEILASLSCLQSLWLEGNPICCARWYRAHVFSYFPHPEKLKLDEKGISTREYWERHIILASRQKRPAGYGFYFPAKDDAEDEGSINTNRKRHSRLASIKDEEQQRYLFSEAVDQESVPCDSDNLRKDENAISDGESEIVGLMNRVEFMKKERSVLWLRELREWMDQTSEGTVDGSKCIDLDPSKEKYIKQRKSQRHLGKSSRYAPDGIQASEGESSSNILESDMSFTDTCNGAHGNGYFDSNGKGILEPSLVDGNPVSINSLRIGGVSSEQDQLMVHSSKPPDHSLEVKAPSQHNSSAVERGDLKGLEIRSASFTAIDEIMGSRSSSIYPGSPPHYQEDILHRRHNLEEEFLHLSAESYSVASSDSDTSCSDDSCRDSSSIYALDNLMTQESTKLGICGHSAAFLYESNHREERHEEASFGEDSRSSSESCPEQDSRHGKPFFAHDVLDDAGGDGIDRIVSQEVGGVLKRKGKRKLKRRVISLLEENLIVCGMEPKFLKLNGVLEVGKADMKNEQGQPKCIDNCVDDSREEADMILSLELEVKNSPISGAHNSLLKTKPSSFNLGSVEFIENFFNVNVADSRISETCQELIRCDCILQLESSFQEREVAVLLSSNNKLYMLLIDAVPNGPGTISKVLGCHRLEDIREVVVGLGLQAMRVRVEEDATYLFLPRNIEKSKDLLCLLRVYDSSALSNRCTLRSWEQVQVELLENQICGNLKMSIFLYSMLLFWHDKCEGESWLSRSLFVIGGYMLVCIENLVQFSSFADDFGSSPHYFSLDSCCPIQNILEMVIEDSRCLTLTVDHVTSGKICFTDKIEKERQPEKTQALTWKLKWFSEETLLKFVALLKAIHSGLTESPLPVKCIS